MLDAWWVEEDRMLPTQAWASLLAILDHNQWALPPTTLSLYKQVLLEKKDASIPHPRDYRPIDLFSVILRIATSCQMQSMKQWLRDVTHKCQRSTHGGILVALAEVTLRVG